METAEVAPPLPAGFVLEDDLQQPPSTRQGSALPPGFVEDQPATGMRAALGEGYLAPGREGASQIPGQAPEAGAMVMGEKGLMPGYTAPPAPAPLTLRQQIDGAAETIATMASGALASILGPIAGVAHDVTSPGLGRPENRFRADRRAEEVMKAMTYQPKTEAGQRQVAAIGELAEPLANAIPAMPLTGELQALGRGMRPAVQAVGDAVRADDASLRTGLGATLKRDQAPPKAAGGSVGAAGADVATARRERAEALPVPIKLTKGQSDRSFEQQRFERETAKDPEHGKPLRERFAEQNEAVLKNFDAFIDETGAEELDRGALGRKVVDPIMEKAERAKEQVRTAYRAADEAGETEELVPTNRIVAKLREIEPSAANAGVIKTAEAELVRLGGAGRDADGNLVPGEISLKSLEELRKTIGVGGRKDATNSHFAGELKTAIDASTDGAGGELYKAARKLHSDYAKEFKEQGVIRDLISLKKNSSDRVTAMEEVFDRAVLKGDTADLENVRRTLVTAGPKGEQAWRDVRGKALDHLKEQAFGNSARDERGNPVASPAKLDAAIKRLDRDGKLELLFGKRGAEQLRDINDVTKDIYTAPPGSVNTSNTASVVLAAMDAIVSGASGAPLPVLTGLKFLRDKSKAVRTAKKVREALGPDGDSKPAAPGPKRFADQEAAETESKPAPAETKAPEAETKPSAGATDPRLAEIDKLREGASPETLKVLDERAKQIQREIRAAELRAARDAEAKQLEATASKTEDKELRAALIERANKLRGEKIPVGEAKEVTEAPPTGRAPELKPLPVPEVVDEPTTGRAPDMKALPVGKTKELEEVPVKAPAERSRLPEPMVIEVDDTNWRQRYRFGKRDAALAKDVALALESSEAAVLEAFRARQNSPAGFEMEIRRILKEGETHASDAGATAGGRQGLERPVEAVAGGARAQGEGGGRGAEAGARAVEAEGQAEPQAREEGTTEGLTPESGGISVAEAFPITGGQPARHQLLSRPAVAEKLAAALDAGVEETDVDRFLQALHAPEFNRVVSARNPRAAAGAGMTNTEARALLERFTPEQRKALDQVAKAVHEEVRQDLDAMVESGAISQETREALGRFRYYVPLGPVEDAAQGLPLKAAQRRSAA